MTSSQIGRVVFKFQNPSTKFQFIHILATRLTLDTLTISKLQSRYVSSDYNDYGLWTAYLWTGSRLFLYKFSRSHVLTHLYVYDIRALRQMRDFKFYAAF